MGYENDDKRGVADARFAHGAHVPCLLLAAPRADLVVCWAGMTTAPDRWPSPPRQIDAASIRSAWGDVWRPSWPMCPAASCRTDLALLLSAVWCWLSQQGERYSGCGLGWVIRYTSVRHIARIRIVIRVRQIPDVCKIVASRSKGKSGLALASTAVLYR